MSVLVGFRYLVGAYNFNHVFPGIERLLSTLKCIQNAATEKHKVININLPLEFLLYAGTVVALVIVFPGKGSESIVIQR